MNLSTRLLSLFLTLAHCKNFTAASDRVHMSQSAFSQAISRLEKEVGVKLFERNTRRVTLTPEGEFLLPVAQRLVQDTENVMRDLKDFAEGKRGKVSIAALAAASAEWIPKILADYLKLYPDVKVRLYDRYSDELLDLIRTGVVDFGINREVGQEDEFEHRLLFDDVHYLICRSDHPLAKLRQVTLKQLAGFDYIHPLHGSSLWQRLDPHLSRITIRDTGHTFANMSTGAGLIANGIGITVVAGQSLFNFQPLGLSAIPVLEPGLKSAVYVVQRRGHALSVAASALLDLIVKNPPSYLFYKDFPRSQVM